MICDIKHGVAQAKRNLETGDVIKNHKEAERLAAAVSSKDTELASLREALARERAEKERLRAQVEKAERSLHVCGQGHQKWCGWHTA